MKETNKINQHFIFSLGLFFSLCIYVLVCLFLAYISLKSQTKLVVVSDKKVLELSEKLALKQIGEKEIKPNYSPKILEYLNSVGLNSPNPYCAAGQYYAYCKAVDSLNQSYKYKKYTIPIYKTASTRIMYNKAKSLGQKVSFKAEKHDLIFWKRGNTIFGHVERVYEVEKVKINYINNQNNRIKLMQTGWVKTIAFNTDCSNEVFRNNSTKQEGVCLKRRNIYHILGRLSVLGLIGFKT